MTPSTAERLRAAAEELLHDKGQAATTLRDITERADANVAAVSYHYGSKDALLALVFADALREVADRQRRRLEALDADAPLEALVRVWLAPALSERGKDARETRLWALIRRGMTERAPGMLENLEVVREVVDTHLVARLAAALPHLGPEELKLRHDAVLAAVGAVTSAETALGPDAALPDRVDDMLVAWVVGGLCAPAAPPP